MKKLVVVVVGLIGLSGLFSVLFGVPQSMAASLPGCGMAAPCNFSVSNIVMQNVKGTNSLATGIEANQGLRYSYRFTVCKEKDSKLVSWWVVFRHQKLITGVQERAGDTLKFDGTRMFVMEGKHNQDKVVGVVPYTVTTDEDEAIDILANFYGNTLYVYNMQGGVKVLIFTYIFSADSSQKGDIALYTQAGTDYTVMNFTGKVL